MSGTKVEFQVKWFLDPIGNPEPRQTPVKDVWVKDLKISLGGEVIFTDAHEYGLGTYQTVSPSFRFASTKWADATTIPIKVEAVFRCSSLGQDYFKTYSHTYSVKSWNQLQTLGTTVAESGLASPEFESASNLLTQAAVQALSVSHTCTPGSSATGESRSSILSRLWGSTVMAALAHGMPDSFMDSYADELISFHDDVLPIVASKFSGPISAPPFSIVGLWSCNTMGAASKAAFGVGGTNSAYVGFDKSVSAVLWPGEAYIGLPAGQKLPAGFPTHSLGEHAKAFWLFLGDGDTVEEALERANSVYPPLLITPTTAGGLDINPGPMQINGDKYARLKYVYLNQTERSARSDHKVWWIQL